MNEQLIVKNFGPIKDATVDFKRVTVFIGPTGGGKSTLAKLAATVKQGDMIDFGTSDAEGLLAKLGIDNYIVEKKSFIDWKLSNGLSFCIDNTKDPIENKHLEVHKALEESYEHNQEQYKSEMNDELNNYLLSPKGKALPSSLVENIKLNFDAAIKNMLRESMIKILFPSTPHYIPAERILLSSIGHSWAGIIRDDIGLPKLLIEFANSFSVARKAIKFVNIPFLHVNYSHEDNHDFIESVDSDETFNLHETASGIQSVTPLLVLLEHLSRDIEQAQSFIIEEPELNLYPTAQQGLLNWLVEKCTTGENDLTITTHSPYLLAHFNTLLFAHQVAQTHPERADEIAKIVPRESWIDPKEFAAYHVEGQKENGVRSIVNPETGLISYNGLDAIASAEATEFEKLLDINAGLEVEW